jgi:hypothetical protein
MPADRGLAGLGLLMQISGSVFLAMGAYIALLPILTGAGPGGPRLEIFLIGVFSALRSISQRSAGTAILYGSAKGYMRNINMYGGIALAQSISVVLVLAHLDVPGKFIFFVFAVLMTWPVVVLSMLRSKRFQDIDGEIPATEDMGFESAAVFMTIFGMMGTFAAGCVLLSIFKSASSTLSEVPGILWTLVVMMLLARSLLHLRAGWQGVSGIDADVASHRAGTYFQFGVVSSVIAAAFLMLQLLMQKSGLGPEFFIVIAMSAYLLLAWPTAMRVFFTDRNFSMLLDEGKTHRRAADTGLTALGWILLGTGSMALTYAIGSVLLFRGEINELNQLAGAMGSKSSPSLWLGLGVAALQTFAGFELVRMSDRHRIATTIYGAVAVVAMGYQFWPVISQLDMLVGMGFLDLTVALGPIFLSLPLAVAALVLVNRNTDPDAKARIAA